MHSRNGPYLSLSTRLQSLVNLYKCIGLPYFLSANNIYYPSFSNRFLDAVYPSRIYYSFQSWPPPLTLPTRLQSLLNLYERIQLRYFLSVNNTYCPSFSKLSLIQCIFLVIAVHSEHGPPFFSFYTSTNSS